MSLEKLYPIPYRYKEQVNRELQEIAEGIIEKANTKYISSIVVVPKSNREIRLCLDARSTNRFTLPQYEASLSIDAISGRITEAKMFSKIDLKHSFWLIPLHKDSRDYTGFQINGVIYRFCVVPFGLQSVCSALVRALHEILDKYENFVVHYIDILIYSGNEEEHVEHIDIVCRELEETGSKINLEKCKFSKKEVIYLGFKLN